MHDGPAGVRERWIPLVGPGDGRGLCHRFRLDIVDIDVPASGALVDDDVGYQRVNRRGRPGVAGQDREREQNEGESSHIDRLARVDCAAAQRPVVDGPSQRRRFSAGGAARRPKNKN